MSPRLFGLNSLSNKHISVINTASIPHITTTAFLKYSWSVFLSTIKATIMVIMNPGNEHIKLTIHITKAISNKPPASQWLSLIIAHKLIAIEPKNIVNIHSRSVKRTPFI